jgi:hypothetical protein
MTYRRANHLRLASITCLTPWPMAPTAITAAGPWFYKHFTKCVECGHELCLLCSPVYIPTRERTLDQQPKAPREQSHAPSSVYSEGPTSVFSAGQSYTTPTSIASDSASLSSMDQFVSLLMEKEQLRRLCITAIESHTIGRDRFERTIRRLLRLYGAELRREATVNRYDRRVAATIVMQRSCYFSTKVRRFCEWRSQAQFTSRTARLTGND